MALLIAAGARVVNIYAASDLIKHMSGTLQPTVKESTKFRGTQ